MTLVIMAAGLGSRFGGLKQIEPVGPNGEFIIDYSIYDAIKAGFDKVVFIIKEENYDLFRNSIGKRVEGKIKVEYVFQNNSNVPSEFTIPSDRVKPLGTGHAILCSKEKVDEAFAMINADDFYGRDAYMAAANFIRNNNNENNYGLVSYKMCNTLTAFGAVKRGVCEVVGNKLVGIIESKIEEKDGKLYAESLEGGDVFEIPYDVNASMNLFIFYPTVYNYLEKDFYEFLKNSKDLGKDEYLLPSVICNHMKKGDVSCELVENNSTWMGITYREDLDKLKQHIKDEINKGTYPLSLY